MTRRLAWRLPLALVLVAASVAYAANAVDAVDGAIPLEPKRVIALAPSLTEMVFATGGGDKLVGVSAYSDFPQAAQKLPQVADAAGISWESLIALKPDLVVAWQSGNRPADIARLQSLGIEVMIVDVKRLADVPSGLRAIGARLGRRNAQTAESVAGTFEKTLAVIRNANAGKRAIRTFVEISAKPLMTVNRDHVLTEMLAVCGGENVFADSPTLVSEPSSEVLLQRGADAILRAESSNPSRNESSADFARYDGLAAFQNHRIYSITADYAFRPGPRLLLAVDEICAALERARNNVNNVKSEKR